MKTPPAQGNAGGVSGMLSGTPDLVSTVTVNTAPLAVNRRLTRCSLACFDVRITTGPMLRTQLR